MLRYNKEEKVELIPPSSSLPIVKKLIEEYKDDKELLQKIYVYVFNVYSRESLFTEFTPEERRDRVCLDLFDNTIRSEYFEKNKIVKEFIDLFIDMTLSSVERDHERCKRDIEELHNYISEIPFNKKQRIKRTIAFKDDETGKDLIKEVDIVVDIDNSEEKIKAIGVREKLYGLDQKLRKLVEVEKIERELSAKTMFDCK